MVYLTESVDEYVMQHLDNFQDIQFQNAVKEKLTLGGKDDKEKKKEKALRVSRPHSPNLTLFHTPTSLTTAAQSSTPKVRRAFRRN